MTARTTTDLNQLMLRASDGDEAAFRRFYDLTAPVVLAILVRLLKDRFVAEDVLQDAMVIAWRKASSFDPERATARTWVITIARRRALDVLRRDQRYDALLRDQAADIAETIEPAPDRIDTESSATAERLAACFRQLQTTAADCIRLAYLDGCTFSEIARRTKRPINTVKSWVRRGMARLQGCMQR